MMSYLWILLLGCLLASHGKAQDDDTTLGPVDPVSPDAGTDDAIPTTEPSPASTEPEEAETLVTIDPEETTPSEQAEPTVEAGEGDGATEATVEEAETTTPEAEVPADAETTPAPEPAVPEVVDAETEAPTPGDALIETTVAEGVLTTQGAGSGLGVEPEQTTQSVEEEVPVVTDAPAIQEEAGGDEKTTPGLKEEETTLGPLILEPEIGVKTDHGVKTELDEFDLSDALGDGTADNGQTKTGRSGSFSAEPVKEGEKTSTQEGNSKPLAAVLSAIVVSAVGAVTGYFAYQKKKLCFKNRGEADPETGNNTVKADAAEAQSDPQVLSNLLPDNQ